MFFRGLWMVNDIWEPALIVFCLHVRAFFIGDCFATCFIF